MSEKNDKLSLIFSDVKDIHKVSKIIGEMREYAYES